MSSFSIPAMDWDSDVVVTLKEAINAFHNSIMKFGPYKSPVTANNSRPLEVFCFWPQSEVWNHRGKCLYICDMSALTSLEAAWKKVPIIERGVAFPHINIGSEIISVDWFMFKNTTKVASDISLVTPLNSWFLVPQEIQDLLDYVACLHNLVPVRRTVSLKYRLEKNLASFTQLEISLTTIIFQPGNLIATFHDDNNRCASSDMKEKCTVCITDKKLIEYCCHLPSSEESAQDNIDIGDHIIMRGIPPFLRCLIDQSEHCFSLGKVSTNDEYLQSEITIKEEPVLDVVEFLKHSSMVQCKSTLQMSPIKVALAKEEETECMSHHNKEEEENNRLRSSSDTQVKTCRLKRTSIQKNFGRLLQCPKCPAAFKHGLRGGGLCLLLNHIHHSHMSVVTQCLSAVMKRYASVIRTP